MRVTLLIPSSLLLCLHAATASSEPTKLIVTLDTSHESLPEFLCIVGQQECSRGRCSSLADLKDAMSFDGAAITFDATAMRREIEHEPLRDALKALSPRNQSSHDKGQQCSQCTPEMIHVEYMGTPDRLRGYVTCTKNRRTTRSDRVALTFLRFHKNNVPSPISSVELLGDHATVYFSEKVAIDDYEFLISIGGDYLSNTVGLGTKERMVLPLHPRCTSSTIVLPSRAREPAAEALPAPPAVEVLSVTLDGTPVDECVERGAESISAWLPYRSTGNVKTLRLAYTSSTSSVVYEAPWAGRSPPDLLKAHHRQLEFSWQKDCLVGTLPAIPGSEWSASCPRAILPAVGARCALMESSTHCRYRCTTEPGVAVFDLPTPVRFDRYGLQPSGNPKPAIRAPVTGESTAGRTTQHETFKAYSWEDTLAYAGQELTSFMSPRDRPIIVELPAPEAWKSGPGNEIEHVEIRSSTNPAQVVTIGATPPGWAIISAPNATCTERFGVSVIGSQTFARVEQGLSDGGNLVLRDPRDYRDLLHWTFTLGGGVLLPQNQLVYRTERRGEIHGSVGAGLELYVDRPFTGAFELTLLYEPTRTAYGAVQLPRHAGARLETVPYHRGIMELAVTNWGHKRRWQLGLMGGGGLGGPMYKNTEKVGTLRFFVFGGMLGRIRPWRSNVWIEGNAGLRWREKHQFFGTDEHGQPIRDTFHGEPMLTERALLQPYMGLRIRWAFL